MNCADLEILLCDYMDGTLAPGEKAGVERHLEQCAACAAMARDVQAAMGFMERAAEAEPPRELLTRIVHELDNARGVQPGRAESRGTLRRWFQVVRQPRFAMGCAMTILSLSMFAKLLNIPLRQPTAEELKPTVIVRRLEDQAYRIWQQARKNYESLRLVYEIQTQLRDWTQKDQEMKGRAANAGDQANPPANEAGTAGESPNSNGTAGANLRNKK